MMKSILLIALLFSSVIADATVSLSADSSTDLVAGHNHLLVANTGLSTVYIDVYTPTANRLNVTVTTNINFNIQVQGNNQFTGFDGFLNANSGLTISFNNDNGVTANITISSLFTLPGNTEAALQLFSKTANGQSYGAIDATSVTTNSNGGVLNQFSGKTYVFSLPTNPISRTYTFAAFDFSISGSFFPRLYNSSFALTSVRYNYTFGGNNNFYLSASANNGADLQVYTSSSFGSTPSNAGAKVVVSPYYVISASNSVDASLVFDYTSMTNANGQTVDPKTLSWFRYSNNQWTQVSTSVDLNAKVVVANTNQFSTWTVASTDGNGNGAGSVVASVFFCIVAMLLVM